MGILGLKLRTNTPCADVIKILKQSENGDRKVTPFLLQNLLEQYKEIAHQIQEIVDLEAED